VQKAKYNKITLGICCMLSIHFGVVYDFASPAGEVPVMSDIEFSVEILVNRRILEPLSV
jgi:hypothetical protein